MDKISNISIGTLPFRKPVDFANLETLSMVMLDYNFNGEVFDLDEVFYAKDLEKNGCEVRSMEEEAFVLLKQN